MDELKDPQPIIPDVQYIEMTDEMRQTLDDSIKAKKTQCEFCGCDLSYAEGVIQWRICVSDERVPMDYTLPVADMATYPEINGKKPTQIWVCDMKCLYNWAYAKENM